MLHIHFNEADMENGKFFKVKIAKHTPLQFGNDLVDAFHKDMVGKVILVKKTSWDGAYYETFKGESILKADCQPINA